MKLSKKHLLAAALPITLAAGAQVLQRLQRQTLPQLEGVIKLAGLEQPVEILRDTWGVPHIYAQTEHDLFFAQGFVHAQDRLFQMDMGRRVGNGRLSEIIGPLGLPADRFSRVFGWQRAANRQVKLADPATHRLAAAYQAGINVFIAQGKLPMEYTLLAVKPEPWQLEDIAAWGMVLGWSLSANWQNELARALLLETLGVQKTADLTLTYPENYQTILPDTHTAPDLFNAMLAAYEQAMSYLPIELTASAAGSNNWVVNGTRTASGRPILANDPHLPPFIPTFWYENHLSGGQYNITGFTMPGVPGIIIGHNEHIAWGVTNAFPDVQDLYLERLHPTDPTKYELDGEWKQVEVVTETIRVRGRKPITMTVRYTHHGPIITDLLPNEKRALSLRWIGHTPTNHLRTVFALNAARDWHTFNESLRDWGFPSQNIVYADVQGHIGYVMPGLVPVRGKGHGTIPAPGWLGEYDWTGWVPFEEMPRRFDPPEGAIVTANNRVVGAGYPHFLTGEWLTSYRADRILELLNHSSRLTMDVTDHIQVQLDSLSAIARRFLPLVLPYLTMQSLPDGLAAEAVGVLQGWDYQTHTNSVAASLFYGWLVHFVQAVVNQAVGANLAKTVLGTKFIEGLPGHPFHKVMDEIALRWLERGAPLWVGDITAHIRPSFLKTIEVLCQKFGRFPANWQWGNLHRVELYHPLSRIPILGRLWKPLVLPIPGDSTTVNHADVSLHFPPYPVQLIASVRMVLDVGEWDNSLAALPGGQSGHAGSPYFQDGAKEWQNGRYHPMLFSRAKIEAATAHTLHLLP